MEEEIVPAESRRSSLLSGQSSPEEEIPEDMLCGEQNLSITDVAGLLEDQFAIITGGKSREGYPLITLPDVNNFAELSDCDYQKLMMYLTSVPSMHEADLGFAILIDRRNDKWSSVKTTLLKISAYFPGLIHVAYVIRPSGFIQKAISEVSNKFFKEEFKFKVVVCSTIQELHKCLDKSELTADMDGTMPYCHKQWMQQRIALEEFSQQMASVSRSLDIFTFELRGSGEGLACAGCTGAGVSVIEVESTLAEQARDYMKLKENIAEAARRGEQLLNTIRRRIDAVGQQEPSSFVNITTVERLLVQLEETERTFDDYWDEHSARSRQYLEIYRFYSDFKLIQGVLEQHLKTVAQLTEIGETVQRVEYLIREFNSFKKICLCDMERSEELVSFGRLLVKGRHYWPLECVTLRCDELDRACASLMDRLAQRSDTLACCHQLQITVDKANRWCQWGIELLGTSHIEKCSCALDAAERSLSELITFLSEAEHFTNMLLDYSSPETKALVSQVLQRIDDVRTMCNKRVTTLKRLVEKPPRPVQTVNPEPRVLASAVNLSQVKTNIQFQPPLPPIHQSPKFTQECTDGNVKSCVRLQEKEHEIKRHHVLTELLETERVYVTELGSIIKGYKHAMTIEETKTLVPPELEGKADVLFGNLEDIYTFHGDIFLQDLENCISTTELVALCFTHRRDSFHKLYSCYCQNMTRSERLRESLGDNSFFRACQLRLGHKLPLAAYLLKPVQRITKYQLLLKDLLAYSEGQKWCSELQEALECMLEVLKCVNDSMHQIAITGFWGDLGDLGDLLTQGSFSIWSECKKDRLKELRLKPMQRHIFLYQKAMLFCKKTATHNKATYLFKRLLKMGEIGLTETVRGDGRTFEIWLSGRTEVHTIQAGTPEEKTSWVEQIKSLLLHQLTQLKMRQVTNKSMHMRSVRQAVSLDSGAITKAGARANSCDENNLKAKPSPSDEDIESSSDLSNSEDEETFANQASRYIALADYNALGHSELTMKEGDKVSLLKVGCAGWWYVRHLGLSEGSKKDGWVPAAYLEHCGRKSSSRSSQSVTSQNSSNND